MKILLSLFSLLAVSHSFGQKKTIDASIYNDWKSLRSTTVSNNGRYISYEINPHRGDGFLYLFDKETSVLDSFPKGKDANFSAENDFFVFKRSAGFDTLRTCELKKIDKKKWPKDTLVILRLSDKNTTIVPNLKSFQISEKGKWMAYAIDSIVVEKKEATEDKKKRFTKIRAFFNRKEKDQPKEKDVKISSDGNLIYLFQPENETLLKMKDVTDFQFSPKGNFFLYTQHQKVDKNTEKRLFIYDFAKKETFQVDTTRTEISNISISKSDKYLAYLASTDTAKVKNSYFQLFDLNDRKNYIRLDSTIEAIGEGRAVSGNQSFVFTENEKYLFVGVDKLQNVEPEDSLLSSEKAKLDLWHYQDQRLQPQQLTELKKDEKKTQLHVLHLYDFALIALENDSLKTSASKNIEGDFLLLSNKNPYEATYNWEFPNRADHYRISLIDGTTQLLKTGIGMGGQLSPTGKFYTYYNDEQQQHYVIDIDANTGTCITCGSKDVNWQTDNNGMPFTAFPYGIIGWEKGEKAVYLQAELDIFKFEIDSRYLTSITEGLGAQNNWEFRLKIWERDSAYISPENSYFTCVDKTTKAESIYEWKEHNDHTDIVKLFDAPNHAIEYVSQSENKETILLRQQSLQDYPELMVLDENFTNQRKISRTNPQQDDYNWASVELLDYTSYDGQKLQALLYKPENYDASKTYPLLVYFYELYTDRLHNYYSPKPTASIIYPTEYASAGYMVLIPDIRYKPGYPAQSAYNCIMASTDAAIKKYTNIDSTRMGLQGQSWGGYQTAQLITMTTRYKAAMAGAPVANMFSAYGGIRWGSGLNRQFQYEKTQSRIGKTIWEAPELYVENSPLFHLPKVTTPLLIMHNDEDGAVPWYQGIELFTGMKRLGKPCWLLNYNGDDHNLMKNANRFDLSIRMRQFFDYYLMDSPAPKWLIDGIPATSKGKEYRLELIEE